MNKIEKNEVGYVIIKNQNNICGICKDELLEDNKIKEELIKTNCNHIFHFECLEESYKQNINKYYEYNKIRQCPYCRKDTGYIPLINNNMPY